MLPVENGIYGLNRVGKDFIVSFGGWLRANRWRATPEEPAVMIYWQVEDEATVGVAEEPDVLDVKDIAA